MQSSWWKNRLEPQSHTRALWFFIVHKSFQYLLFILKRNYGYNEHHTQQERNHFDVLVHYIFRFIFWRDAWCRCVLLFQDQDLWDYMISSWSTGFWKITGTIISTNAGAAVFIGWMGLGFTVGFSGYFKFALVAYFFSLLLVILFAKPLRRQKLFTLADLFTVRFGGRTGMVPSLISAFVYSVPTLALQLIGMSTVFTITLGW